MQPIQNTKFRSISYSCQVGIPLHIYIRATYWSGRSFQRQGRLPVALAYFYTKHKVRIYLCVCVAAGTRQGMDGLGSCSWYSGMVVVNVWC